MATRFHIGAKELRGEVSAYAKRFDFLEILADPKHAPTVTTLRRWRKNVPPHFEFGIVGRVLVAAGDERHAHEPAAFVEEGFLLVERDGDGIDTAPLQGR